MAQPRVLIGEAAIRARVAALAADISQDYAGQAPPLLVGVLKGSFVFLADLVREMRIPTEIDFVAAASYPGGAGSRTPVRLLLDVRADVRGRHVLVVEDIVDTGHTVAHLFDALGVRGPASLECCCLLHKRDRRETDVAVRYVGFEIPDLWVVGYGLDRSEAYRQLPYVGALDPAP